MPERGHSSYREAGVDLDAANAAKEQFAGLLDRKGMTLNRRHSYAAIIDAGLNRFKDPVLVFKSEEPGSKQIIAFQYDRVESVCFDMINHLVNDCIVCGAWPISIQDVVVCGKLEPEILLRIVKAIANAAEAQGCFLSGGETSEQPGVLPEGRYVLTSSILGVVERNNVVDGSSIRPGDVVLGIASSGLHTNGYSLVRRLLVSHPQLWEKLVGGRRFIDVLLDVHMSYERALRPLFERSIIKGAAHITGGGISENLNRILPSDVDAIIDLQVYRPQEIFRVIRDVGEIPDSEMLRTFNMGVGMAIVIDREDATQVLSILRERSFAAIEIGVIVPGGGVVQIKGGISWKAAQ